MVKKLIFMSILCQFSSSSASMYDKNNKIKRNFQDPYKKILRINFSLFFSALPFIPPFSAFLGQLLYIVTFYVKIFVWNATEIFLKSRLSNFPMFWICHKWKKKKHVLFYALLCRFLFSFSHCHLTLTSLFTFRCLLCQWSMLW